MINSNEEYIDAHHYLHTLLRKSRRTEADNEVINRLRVDIAEHEKKIRERGIVKRTVGNRGSHMKKK